jgi:hypothetical protein
MEQNEYIYCNPKSILNSAIVPKNGKYALAYYVKFDTECELSHKSWFYPDEKWVKENPTLIENFTKKRKRETTDYSDEETELEGDYSLETITVGNYVEVFSPERKRYYVGKVVALKENEVFDIIWTNVKKERSQEKLSFKELNLEDIDQRHWHIINGKPSSYCPSCGSSRHSRSSSKACILKVKK